MFGESEVISRYVGKSKDPYHLLILTFKHVPPHLPRFGTPGILTKLF